MIEGMAEATHLIHHINNINIYGSHKINDPNLTYMRTPSLVDEKQQLPARILLMFFGLWQSSNSGVFLTFHNNLLAILIWLAVVGGIIAQCFLDSFTWGKLLNSIGTICNLCAPFMICRYYLRNGRFEELLTLTINDRHEVLKKTERLRVVYSLVILGTWALGFTFFYVHFIPFFSSLYHYIFYAFVFLFSLGWWASWLGVYSYICNIHKLQIEQYVLLVKQTYGYSTGSRESEEDCMRILLENFTTLRRSLNKTHADFSKIISFCVAYHILDLIVFSIAYWKKSFIKYDLWQYIGGVLFDSLSILFKLFPAALVNQSLHKVVKTTGEMCYPDINFGNMPTDRYLFYQYLHTRETDLGMRILGVKITSKLTVGIFVTLTSLGLAFLYYAVPFLEEIQIR